MSILDEGFRAPGGPSRNRPHGNLSVLRLAVLGMFAVLAIRLVDMQIINGSEFAQRSEENHIIQKNILPTRGLILDRNGEPLVQNVGVYSAKILPEVLPESKDSRYRIYLKLQDLIGVSPLEVQARVDGMTDREAQLLGNKIDELPAGGDVLGLAVFVFLVLLVTDIAGFTDMILLCVDINDPRATLVEFAAGINATRGYGQYRSADWLMHASWTRYARTPGEIDETAVLPEGVEVAAGDFVGIGAWMGGVGRGDPIRVSPEVVVLYRWLDET